MSLEGLQFFAHKYISFSLSLPLAHTTFPYRWMLEQGGPCSEWRNYSASGFNFIISSVAESYRSVYFNSMQNKRRISTSLIENAGCRISTLRSQLKQRTISYASRSYMLSGSPHNPSFLRGPHNEWDAGAISSGPERNPGIFSASLDVISLETLRGGEGPYFCTHCATPSSCLPDLKFFLTQCLVETIWKSLARIRTCTVELDKRFPCVLLLPSR